MSDAPAATVTENGAPSATQEKIDETPGFKVFAGNLAYSTTDEGLKAFFAPVQSDILSAQVILRGTRSAGYGFVALASNEAAEKAVELLDKKELDGRPVIVEIAKPSDQKDKEKKERRAKRRPGRRGGKAVPGEVTEAEANGEATKSDAPAAGTGDAAKPKKKKKTSRKSKPKTDGEAAPAPVEADAASGDAAKRPARARKPRPPRASRPAGEDPVGEPSTTVLFVANLGFNIDDAGLAALFTEAGVAVNSARIVRRRWGQPRRSKGYGFVDVGGEAEQKKAVELLSGKEVGGRAIAVKIAVNTPREDDEEAKETAPAAVSLVVSLMMNDTQLFFVDIECDVCQRRKEAEKLAKLKNEQNRTKSRRQREVESREAGLSKSLFEKAKEDEAAGLAENKALSIMMKMGFKPGQALGKVEAQDEEEPPHVSRSSEKQDSGPGGPSTSQASGAEVSPPPQSKPLPHRAEPLPLNEWAGKKGIGLGKRTRSPGAAGRLAKMAKMAEETGHDDFRDRARQEYEDRRAEGKLGPAQRTCETLDEQKGVEFNVLWLNPNQPESFPSGLVEALELHHGNALVLPSKSGRLDDTYRSRLRLQMQADALQPLLDNGSEIEDSNSTPNKLVSVTDQFSHDTLEEAAQFLRLHAQDRLTIVLSYLRDTHSYCFWCGIEYTDPQDMEAQCPGPDEDAHD
ncbi:RNA-binding domain-containing protein [Pluteus cervinus]|uniref:RNA-binding domain-containing protein n=1 Tax=Pluteus cervinus TaxID=181527 RepID=A0ACD3BE44_9AGAR|nr:RNA-binding domain-containing protein [Pluteus cervinus]